MATVTKKTGLGVTCPKCHSEDDTLLLDLNDLSEIRCDGCSEHFSAEEARALVAAELERWSKVVRLVEMARELASTK